MTMSKPANNTDRPVVDAAKVVVSTGILTPVALIALLVAVAIVALALSWLGSHILLIAGGIGAIGLACVVFCVHHLHALSPAEKAALRARRAANIAARKAH
jgi:hypothetical protein